MRSIHVGGHVAESSPGFTPNDVGGNYSDIDQVEIKEYSAKVAIGTNLDYARRIEFGFSGMDALGRNYSQAAQPYLRPAMDSELEKVKDEVGKALKFLLDKAVK